MVANLIVCMFANLIVRNIYSTALTRGIQVKQRGKRHFSSAKKTILNDYFSALAEMVAKTPKYIF
jgi:hypothetical protein